MKIYKAAVIAALMCAVLVTSSCFSYKSFDELTTGNPAETTEYHYVPQAENTTTVIVENTTAEVITTLPVIVPESTTAPTVQTENTTAPYVEITTAPVQESTTAAAPAPDYSAYTKAQIIETYAAALDKTRSYGGAITVNHSESFTADIKEAHPGGALTELLASNIVKLVGSEGQQTLNFNGGYAVNADGETVPVLLPQRAAFSLPEQGVASAQINGADGKTYIRIVLVPETVSMGQVPQYNSTAIGYLDTSGMDFKIITISRVDITYPGSVIDAVIGSDGYIESVTYTINMSTYAELSGMGISGYGTLEGAQTEKWQLSY